MRSMFSGLFKPFIDEAMHECLPLACQGKVADYIPALAGADPGAFGVCIVDVGGKHIANGDFHAYFTMQSIAKVLSFILCLLDNPLEEIMEKISVEPSSSAFNAIADLEMKNKGRPLNPMINAGAIATLGLVGGQTAHEKFSRVLELACLLSGNQELSCDEVVYRSEAATGDRNRSLAYYMKSTGTISGCPEELLDAYFRICSIKVTCLELASIAAVLARDGRAETGEELIPAHTARIARTVMAMCGMYDGSGRYAVKVGLPSKSGVGGGIMAVAPGKMGIGIYGPALDSHGGSVCGVALLEKLSEHFALSVF